MYNEMIQNYDIRDAFFDEIYEIARRDASVLFMTADMGAMSLENFRRDFPGRYFNVGISEQNMVSVAAGLSIEGKKVFIYAIVPFVTLRCLEQIKVDLCVMNLPVTVVGAGSGLTYSSDGPTHHAIEDISVMRALPRMEIYNPSDPATAKYAASASYRSSGPAYVRLDKGSWPELYDNEIDMGKGFVCHRSGKKLLIVSSGCMVHSALMVADDLKKYGVDCGVLDLFRLKPVEKELSAIAQEYEKIITIEEHTLSGGLGSIITEVVAENGLAIPVKRFGIPDCYLESYGDRTWMNRQFGLHVDTLSKSVREWL
jgi:transketolase